MNTQPKKLLDQVREAIQLKHDSIRTEEAYVAWIKRYILFHPQLSEAKSRSIGGGGFAEIHATNQNPPCSSENLMVFVRSVAVSFRSRRRPVASLSKL
ncbi:phage integrase N-terminal SAM-like domain-containing protein [Candidatus Poribacteria bacterium]|nr:phage integrase N-terminal SAM-like domain-containing protein [Candidatus Poribacteria bacterium]